MSLVEMKERAKELSLDELNELARHIAKLRHLDDPEWQAEIGRRAQEASEGRNLVSQEEVIAIHRRLEAEGR